MNRTLGGREILRHRFIATALAAGTLGLTSGSALAVDRQWLGGSAGGDGVSFADGLNWSPQGAPGLADAALFTLFGGEVVMPGRLVQNQRLAVSGADIALALDLAGGVYRLNSTSASPLLRSVLLGIGSDESGALELANGGLIAKHAALGVESGSTGSLDILISAEFEASLGLTIGEGGAGTVNVLGDLLAGPTLLAANDDSVGSLLAGSPLASVVILGDLATGFGDADVGLSNGAIAVLLGDLRLANDGGSGFVTVGDLGSTLVVGGDALLGSGATAGDADGKFIGASLALVDSGSASVAGTLVGTADSSVTVGGARLDAGALLLDGGLLAVDDTSVVAIDWPAAPDTPGVVVGGGASAASATVAAGGLLEGTDYRIAPTPDSAGLLLVSGADARLQAFGDVAIGWAPEPWSAADGAARLRVENGGQMAVDGVLSTLQGGRLEISDGSVEVETLSATEDGAVALELAVPPGPAPLVAGAATLSGGLFLSQQDPSGAPAVNTMYPLLDAGTIEDRFSVIVTQPLPGYRYYDFGGVPAAGGQTLSSVVLKLPALIGLNEVAPIELVGSPTALAAGFYTPDTLSDAFLTVGDGAGTGSAVLYGNTGASDGDLPIFELLGTLDLGPAPNAIAQADFNGDGRLDWAVSDDVEGTIRIVLNNTGAASGAALVPGGTFLVGGAPRGVAAAKLTPASPAPDLAWADPIAGTVNVALSDGKGGYGEPIEIAAGTAPSSVCPLDLDNDKDLDLAVLNSGSLVSAGTGDTSASVGIILSLGGGNFAPAVLYEVGAGAVALGEGDLDGDGADDIVTANALDGSVSFLAGVGDGTFRAAVRIAAGGTPTALAVGDFDDDESGDVDIAVLLADDGQGASLTVFRNDSTGGQTVITPLYDAQELFGLPTVMTSSDVDGDGVDDVVVAGGENDDGFVSVIEATPVTCDADFLGEGTVDGTDLGILLADWGESNSPADLNGDGTVDGADLAILLENWGPCPTAGEK